MPPGADGTRARRRRSPRPRSPASTRCTASAARRRSPRWRTAPRRIRAGRRDRRARQRVRRRGQARGRGRRSASTSFAGPSEVVVVADGSAPAAFVAADLLAQAEHGPGGAAVARHLGRRRRRRGRRRARRPARRRAAARRDRSRRSPPAAASSSSTTPTQAIDAVERDRARAPRAHVPPTPTRSCRSSATPARCSSARGRPPRSATTSPASNHVLPTGAHRALRQRAARRRLPQARPRRRRSTEAASPRVAPHVARARRRPKGSTRTPTSVDAARRSRSRTRRDAAGRAARRPARARGLPLAAARRRRAAQHQREPVPAAAGVRRRAGSTRSRDVAAATAIPTAPRASCAPRSARTSASRPSGSSAPTARNEVLQTLLLTYGGPGRRALVFEPTYALHAHIARITGTEVVAGERRRRLLDRPRRAPRALIARAAARRSCSCAARTTRPDRRAAATVEALLDAAADGLVVVDEAYGEFAPWSALELVDDDRPLVVVRTYSKVWSLAALRLGFAVAPAWVVAELEKVVLPYHLVGRRPSSRARSRSTSAPRWTSASRRLVEERERLFAALAATRRASTVFPSGANFLLFRVARRRPRALGAAASTAACSSATSRAGRGVEDCLRVTVGTPEENDAFLAALARGAAREVVAHDEPTATADAAPRRPRRRRRPSTLDVDGARRRVGVAPASRSSTTCSSSSASTAASTCTIEADGRPRGRPAPHRRRRRHRARHRAQARRSATRRGVRRFANALVPLDEALVQVALDLSGRPFLVYEVDPVVGVDRHVRPAARRGVLAGLRRRRAGSRCTSASLSGKNGHHVIEASFKGVARCAARRGADRGRRACRRPRARSVATARLYPAIDLRGGNVRAPAPGRLRRRDRLRRRPGRASRASSKPRARSGSTWSTSTPRAPATARTSTRSRRSARRRVPDRRSGGGVRTVEAARRAARRRRRTGRGRHRRGRAPRAGRRALPRCIPVAVAVGLDARGHEVAIRGWVEGSGRDLVDLAGGSTASGVAALDRHGDRARRHARRPRLRPARRGARRPAASRSSRAAASARSTTSARSPGSASGDRRLAGRRSSVGRSTRAGSPWPRRSPRWSRPWPTDAERDTVGETRSTIDQLTQRSDARMANGSDVIDEGFFRRYRELLDAEDAAFDELEHAYEDGDRAHWDDDLAAWRKVVEKRCAFLEREGLVPVRLRLAHQLVHERRAPRRRRGRCGPRRSGSRPRSRRSRSSSSRRSPRRPTPASRNSSCCPSTSSFGRASAATSPKSVRNRSGGAIATHAASRGSSVASVMSAPNDHPVSTSGSPSARIWAAASTAACTSRSSPSPSSWAPVLRSTPRKLKRRHGEAVGGQGVEQGADHDRAHGAAVLRVGVAQHDRCPAGAGGRGPLRLEDHAVGGVEGQCLHGHHDMMRELLGRRP